MSAADASMSSAVPQNADGDGSRSSERERLRVSRFDVVTSFFMALMLFIGIFVLMLFLIWLTGRFSFPPLKIEPIIENAAGTQNPEGFERDFEPPGADEVEDLQEPTLADTIEAVTDAVSSVAASLATNDTAATATTSGTGQGDSRPPGPEGEGEDIVPRFERWQLEFSAQNQAGYAQQLNFYKIELGVFGKVPGMDIISQLGASPQARKIADATSEKRLYFTFKRPSPQQSFERQFINSAGVSSNGRTFFKLIPSELENLLANIELDYAKSKGHNSVKEIAKTIFESKAESGGYMFEVTSQRYRRVQ